MIIRNNTDPKTEIHKAKLGLAGDVYMVGHFIENLDSHKRLIPSSTAETIDAAEQERIQYEESLRLAREAAESEPQEVVNE